MLIRFRGRDLASGWHCFAEDGGTGTGAGGDPGPGAQGTSGGGTGQQEPGTQSKTFTQDELDAIVQKRVKGTVKLKDLGFESEDEFQSWVKTKRQEDEERKSEQQKAIDAAKEEGTKEALAKAKGIALRAQFLLAAKDAGIVNPSDAFLIAQAAGSLADVEVDDDGGVSGLDEKFFKSFLKERQYLLASGEGTGNEGGTQPPQGAPNVNGSSRRQTAPQPTEERQKQLVATYPALARRRG